MSGSPAGVSIDLLIRSTHSVLANEASVCHSSLRACLFQLISNFLLNLRGCSQVLLASPPLHRSPPLANRQQGLAKSEFLQNKRGGFLQPSLLLFSPTLVPALRSFSPQTVTNDGSFQEAGVKEVKRIYRAEQVVLHSPVVHLQQKTPGHIFFSLSGFYGRLLYGAGWFPILA